MARDLLIVDLEATCWENDPERALESEIIEIGAVLYDPDTKTSKDELQTFVRPVRHPTLSAFCTSLTTIRQRDVDRAPGFAEALDLLQQRFFQSGRVLLASWGDYDRLQLQQDCRLHGLKYPFGKKHLNVKARFAEKLRCRPCSLGQALVMLHMEFEGTPHRGIDDARNIARVAGKVL